MVLMRHTKFIHEVLATIKRRTMRKPRKNPIKVGDTLQHYILMKVGESVVKSIKGIHLYDLTDRDAQLDGFEDATEAIDKLMEMHKKYEELQFNIIDYEPQWEPCIIINLGEVREIMNWWAYSEEFFGGQNVAAKLEKFLAQNTGVK